MFLALAAIVLVLLAIGNEVARSINAHYFPDQPNPVERWHSWGFIAFAVLCLIEALFTVAWKRVKKSKHNGTNSA